MSIVLQTKNLTKQFSEVKAVDGLSFSITKGGVHGFLGQNGAGKSTTIRMILTLIQPTSGSIEIFGKDLYSNRKSILRNIGAIIEKPDLYKYLSALQNLRIMAQLSGTYLTKKQLMQQLERVGLAERANSKIKTFSQGMKQRLGIACALAHEPELIILDEPTNGLDPQGIADMRNLILHLSKIEGKTIFVSSHLLSEIELIADSMLIIDKGKKVAEGSVAELLNPADTLVEIQTTNDVDARGKMALSQWGAYVRSKEGPLQLKMHKNLIPDLNKYLVQNDVQVISIQARHSLETYFLSLTTSNQHVAAYTH